MTDEDDEDDDEDEDEDEAEVGGVDEATVPRMSAAWVPGASK